MKTAIIGVGTNMGDKLENIKAAKAALEKVPMTSVKSCSSVYETAPWGYKEQENFYNAVFVIETELSPFGVLGVCLGIEAALGRVREFKNGPRILDLDLLLYEDERVNSSELNLPHPFMGERDFVLVPLKELFSDLKIFSFDFSGEYEKICKNSSVKAVCKL